MQFDIATAMLMDALVTLLVGLLMLVVTFALPHGQRSVLRLWGISDVMIAIALLALGTRSAIGLLPSVLLGNGLLLFGFAHQYSAIRQFAGRVSSPVNFLPALLAVLLALWLATAIWPNLPFRILLVSILLSAFGLVICRDAYRARVQSAPTAGIIVAGVFLLTAVLFAGLGLKQIFGDTTAGLFDANGPIPLLAMVGGGLLPLLGAVAFLLMCVERSLIQSHQLAITDSLTGLYNRRWIIELAQRQLHRRFRSETRTAFLLMDLDHFKQVNDRHGHLTGDAVLREVVARVERALRVDDLFGRLGGEEFLVVLEGADTSLAVEVAERIRDAIAAKPISVDSQTLPMTTSIGIAVQREQHERTEELLRRADRALYRAKDEGRNSVRTET